MRERGPLNRNLLAQNVTLSLLYVSFRVQTRLFSYLFSMLSYIIPPHCFKTRDFFMFLGTIIC